MKQFFNILKFEFTEQIKTKTFRNVTIIFLLIIAIGLSFPRILNLVQNPDKNAENQDQKIVLLADKTSANNEKTQKTLELFQAKLEDYKIEPTTKTIAELETLVNNQEINSAIVLNSLTDYTYVVKQLSIYDSTTFTIEEIMLENYRLNSLENQGFSLAEADSLLNTTISNSIIQLEKDQKDTFFYTYILIFALYMAILLYGQMVAVSVATEKSSRAMEMLITSAKPTNLMFGKVIGAGLAGLLQMVIILGASFIFWQLNSHLWGDNQVVNSVFNMPPHLLIYTVVFFILGFFIYAFLYGAIGSLASRVEDINSSSTPITFLFIIAFMIVIFSMSSGNINNPLIVIASYIPFTSPMAMFTRIAMSQVPTIQIVISIVILVGSTIAIGWFAAKIYRIGVLLYGKPPKLKDVIKSMLAK